MHNPAISRIVRVVLAAALACAAVVGTAGAAGAQYPPGEQRSLIVCRDKPVRPGDELTVSSGGHESGDPVDHQLDGESVGVAVASGDTACNGSQPGGAVATHTFTVDVEPGNYELCASSRSSFSCAKLHVVGPKGNDKSAASVDGELASSDGGRATEPLSGPALVAFAALALAALAVGGRIVSRTRARA